MMNKGKEGGIQQLLHKGFGVKKLKRKDIWEYTSAWRQEQNVEIIEPEKLHRGCRGGGGQGKNTKHYGKSNQEKLSVRCEKKIVSGKYVLWMNEKKMVK